MVCLFHFAACFGHEKFGVYGFNFYVGAKDSFQANLQRFLHSSIFGVRFYVVKLNLDVFRTRGLGCNGYYEILYALVWCFSLFESLTTVLF